MTKKICFYSFLVLLLLISCGQPNPRAYQKSVHEFTTDFWVKTTPVKDQGHSELCWIYAMLATIESEHLMMGDSVNLSPDFTARMLLQDNAREYFFSRRDNPISMRGMGASMLRLLQRYGSEPYDTYYNREPVNYQVLCRKIEQMARASVSLHQFNDHLQNLLDNEIGFMPKFVFMLGVEYTPLQFAHSVCMPDEYLSLTSYTHHPFGQRFVLESPDNVLRDSFLNIPIDSLMHHLVAALRHGHPVCWEGDISEPGFSFEKGIATLPAAANGDQQYRRQRDFEARRTTDDHAMQLCGLAHDRKGNRFFIAKNSWGTNNPYGGYMFLSYDYVRLKTVALFMSQKAFETGVRNEE